MKHLVYLFALISTIGFSQGKYLTKTGNVTFEASVPSFEEVKGTANSTTAIINSETGDFAALILVKGFRFKNALMEEHFNENYAESDTYPKATFKGNIKDFNLSNLSSEAKTVMISGSLTFHGVTKTFDNLPVSISKKDGAILFNGEFKTNVQDYKIKIPKVVGNKLSETVTVSFDFTLNKK